MIYPASADLYATVAQFSDFYCVYEHWAYTTPDATEPTVIYVGCTKLLDVFTFSDARKNTAWKKMMKADDFLHIRLVKIGHKEECMTFRYNHGKAIKAHCNLYGHEFTIHMKIICNESGEVFNTMGDVVAAHGVSQSALSNHLAGKRGYKTVKSHTYRYEG